MRSEYKAGIDTWFETHREQLLADLADLVSINSVRSEALPGKPYG